MSGLDLVVVVLGTGLIAGELWYFLAPRKGRGVRAPPTRGGVQEVRVLVKNGFEPDTVFVEAGRPVRLLFYRDETAECSERLLMDDFGIDQDLPPFQATPVQFTPADPGDYPFSCGRSSITGRVVAQLGRDGARANLGKGHVKHG